MNKKSLVTTLLACLFFLVFLTPSAHARNPGEKGNWDQQDQKAAPLYCADAFPTHNDVNKGGVKYNAEKRDACPSCIQLIIKEGYATFKDYNDAYQGECSRFSSGSFDLCNKCNNPGKLTALETVSDFGKVGNTIGKDAKIFLDKDPTWYRPDGVTAGKIDINALKKEDVRLPRPPYPAEPDTDAAKQARTRLETAKTPDGSDMRQQILDVCKANKEYGGDSTRVIECMSCAAIAVGFGLPNLEAYQCNRVPDESKGELSLTGSKNFEYCTETCARYKNEIIKSEKQLKEITGQTKGKLGYDIPGVTCGIPDSKYSKCCKVEASLPSCPQFLGLGLACSFIKGRVDKTIHKINTKVIDDSQLGLNVASRCVPIANPNNPGDSVVIENPNDDSCRCVFKSDSGLSDAGDKMCQSIPANDPEKQQCRTCFQAGANGMPGFWTAMGCLPVDPAGFVSVLLPRLFGIAGGVALLTIIYSAFLLQTSQGNPERIKKARQYLMSSLGGLLLIVLSVLFLQIIGVDILKIPGFGK